MKHYFRFFWLLGILLMASPALGGIDLVKLRDSTDDKPAFGTVDFSYLRKDSRKKTDSNGHIKLPPPQHDKADPIEVCPENNTKYGACFRQQFPVRDGMIWLLTLSAAQAAEERADELALKKQFKPAAALTAIASDFYNESEPRKTQNLLRKALSFLTRAYGVGESDAAKPNEALLKAVLADDSVVEKPATEGAWDSLDFLNIAGETRSEALERAGIVGRR
jgi:hypothetical protein